MSEVGEYKKVYSISMILNSNWFLVLVFGNNRYLVKVVYYFSVSWFIIMVE